MKMEPMALGSPAGSPVQTPSSPGVVGSAYLPGFLLGDNNMNRMNNATPDNRFPHQIGQHTPTSPLSSYQTPEYRLNRQKAMFGDTSAANISQMGTENHMGGPPTKSLYESLETRPSISSHCTPNIHNHSMSHNQSRLIAGNSCSISYADFPLNAASGESSQGLLQWITVFGFPASALNTVLAHISSRVRILDKHPAPHPQSNWIHLKCSSEQEAQRALGCNGNVVSGTFMIGVIPCTDEGVIMNPEKENRSMLNDSMRHLTTPPRYGTVSTSRLNVSKTPPRIKNARPLVSGFNQSLNSELALRSSENVPHKTTGLMTKAMEYVFGW